MASTSQPFSTGAPGTLTRGYSSQDLAQARGAAVDQLMNPEVWTMFDTQTFSVAAVPPATTATAFTGMTSTTSFFNSRTIANAGAAISSMTTSSGYVDFPYKAYGMGVSVSCTPDATATGYSQAGSSALSTAVGFVDSVVNGGAITLQFATDPKFIAPVSDLPAGGGTFVTAFTDTRSAASNQVSGSATNGLPSVQSRVLWKDPILFRGKDTPFTVVLSMHPEYLKRVQNLPPLATVSSIPQLAVIQIKFWGYRGKLLVNGSSYRQVARR